MRRIARPAALLAVTAALAGCGGAASLLSGEPPVWGGSRQTGALPGIAGRFDWSGTQSEIQGRTTVVARTEEEWQALWRQAAEPPPAPLPPGWMAVAVFAGVQNTGGYAVELVDSGVVRRIDSPERLLVTYRIRTPSAGTATPQALSSPWALRLVRDSSARVDFDRIS